MCVCSSPDAPGFFSRLRTNGRETRFVHACLPGRYLNQVDRRRHATFAGMNIPAVLWGTRPAAVTSQTSAVAHSHSQTYNMACGVECRTSKIAPGVSILCSQYMNVVKSFVMHASTLLWKDCAAYPWMSVKICNEKQSTNQKPQEEFFSSEKFARGRTRKH